MKDLKSEMINQKMLQTLTVISKAEHLSTYQYIIDLDSNVMWEKEMVTQDRVTFYSGNFKSVNEVKPIADFDFKNKKLMEFSDVYYKYLVVCDREFTTEELSFQAFLFFNNLKLSLLCIPHFLNIFHGSWMPYFFI